MISFVLFLFICRRPVLEYSCGGRDVCAHRCSRSLLFGRRAIYNHHPSRWSRIHKAKMLSFMIKLGTFTCLCWQYTRGPVHEIDDPNVSVIQGSYRDYSVRSLFATDFVYSQFSASLCNNVPAVSRSCACV